MKKLFVLIALLILPFSAFVLANEPHFEVYMQEEYRQNHPQTRSPQGGAVYGRFLFQFHDWKTACVVYDLEARKQVVNIPMDIVKTHHCNNVEFSSTYLKKGDEFPLLYVGMENIAEHCALVYRVSRTAEGGFTASQIQKIVFPSPEQMGLYYPNIYLDLQGGYIYVGGFSRPSWKSPDNGNTLQLLRFPMPPVKEGETILTIDDVLQRFSAPFRVATQGGSIRNGKLYQVFGVAPDNLSLCCFDLSDGSLVREYDLARCGICEEPEALSFYKDELFVVGVSGKVYSSGMFVPWELGEDLAATAPAFVGGARKKLVCMDLDATLTQHRTQIEDYNVDALNRLGGRYDLVMVCAGNTPRVYRQMNNYPIDILGNYGMEEAHVRDGELEIVRQSVVPADTAYFLEKTRYLREKYGYTEYDGDPVEFHAAGMVTFALLGTEAKTEKKVVFDPDRSRRRVMYEEVKSLFPDYAVFIGGSTSFDFAPGKYNKYDAALQYAREHGYSLDEVIFIGDDFGDGGGDSHVRINGMDYIYIDDYRQFSRKVAPLLLER